MVQANRRPVGEDSLIVVGPSYGDLGEDVLALISPPYGEIDRTEQQARYRRGFSLWYHGDPDRPYDPRDDPAFNVFLMIAGDHAQNNAGYDWLTGLPNMGRLAGEFAGRRASVRRYGGGGTDAIGVVDLTMKRVNDDPDLGGHAAGNRFLREAAGVMRRAANRETDRIYRIGGDEFGVLLPETDAYGAMVVAHRIVRGLGEVSDRYFRGIASGGIGVHTFRMDPETGFEDVLGRADGALYEARRRGKEAKEARRLLREPPTAVYLSELGDFHEVRGVEKIRR